MQFLQQLNLALAVLIIPTVYFVLFLSVLLEMLRYTKETSVVFPEAPSKVDPDEFTVRADALLVKIKEYK